jgi:hypothetical protein
MRTHPEIFLTRAEAERALWKMAMEGKADSTQDRRFRAMVLLATFASLRWGGVSALRRMDVDHGEVRVRNGILTLMGSSSSSSDRCT